MMKTLLLGLAILFALFPRPLVYPLVVALIWISGALLYRGYKLHRKGAWAVTDGDQSRDSNVGAEYENSYRE